MTLHSTCLTQIRTVRERKNELGFEMIEREKECVKVLQHGLIEILNFKAKI